MIFDGFDQTYKSLNTSVDLQIKFLEAIDENLWKVEAYKVFIDEKLKELKEKLKNTTDEKEKMKLEMFIRNVEFLKSRYIYILLLPVFHLLLP